MDLPLNRPHIIIFARPPVLGKVKTRIAKEVGDEKALQIYTELLHHTLNTLSKMDQTAKCTIAWHENHPSIKQYTKWHHWIQPAGNLGEKMSWALKLAFDQGAPKVIIIGTDSPGLSSALLHDAIEKLNHTDIVLGPSEDGGYYLVGATCVVPSLFPPIQWGSKHVLQETIKSLESTATPYLLLEPKYDIDHLSDWKRWQTHINS